ncbi:hypothetical protein [Natrinema sp. SYSU A 869]|uniref:hypothetical protein n=1 Tax=Natrinema sp. SYSU A 869 TaxID=2871694 RepID=UPI002107B5A5|nr:hypothetical protein [Natrinema sp. SYSU A 869]
MSRSASVIRSVRPATFVSHRSGSALAQRARAESRPGDGIGDRADRVRVPALVDRTDNRRLEVRRR